ncbi:MAG: hypothetical protein DWQ35_06120 [Planctomycetota bacterium]|nr:MAG: hypothetical protein DWQ35_06120 [Planctomycetota bacterium]
MAGHSTAVLCGPARCGKTTWLLARYREVLRRGPLGAGLWLAPTARSAGDLRRRLADESGFACLQPQIRTFDQFSRDVLRGAQTSVRLVTGPRRRRLIRTLIEQARRQGRFAHFDAIAETEGLIHQVEAFLSELKRLEIWPAELRAACEARGAAAKDREFVGLYESYQDALQQHDLFDVEGCNWAARALLQEGHVAPYEAVRFVVVDGFTDFTRTQHEMLEVLAGRVEEIWITLPLEPDERRRELFDKARRTLAELERRHPGCRVEQRSVDDSLPPLANLAAALFAPQAPPEPLQVAGQLDVIAAPQDVGELREVARRVKKLLVREGVPAADIAVVFRSLAAVATLVREVFGEYGVPIDLDVEEPLARSPLVTTLLSLLRLHHEDWPFRRLLALLVHRDFCPEGCSTDSLAVAIESTELVIRRLQIPQGREELLTAMARLAERPPRSGNAEQLRRDQTWQSRAQRGRDVLERLAAALDQLPEQASLSEWAMALERLLVATGFVPNVDDSNELSPARQRDAAELATLLDSLRRSADLQREFGGPEAYTHAQVFEVLEDIAALEPLPPTRESTGHVRVLAATSVRTLEVPYLFVAGLAEQAFPPPLDVGRLYNDSETAQLIDAGLPLPSRQLRGREEMLLFYEVLTRATRQLTLSYPATDAKGEPLLPSPFLDEVIRLCGEDQLQIKRVTVLRPLPDIDEPLSEMELRIGSVEQALAGAFAPLAAVIAGGDLATGSQNLLPAIEAIYSRGHLEYGLYEGLLDGAEVEARLRERYGSQRAWSASQLEEYAACPHKFYLGEVLGLEPLADLVLEDDYQLRGSLLHHALATVHRQLNEARGQAVSPVELDQEAFLAEFSDVLGELLESWGAPAAVERALREIDRRNLMDWAGHYLQQHRDYDADFAEFDEPPRPAHFEVGFGLADDEDADENSTRDPLILGEGDEAIRISGRVDRVDVGRTEGQPLFNVIDYKSGRRSPSARKAFREEIEAGRTLQLPLYAMAIEQLEIITGGALPWQAGYWTPRDKGFVAKRNLQLHATTPEGIRPTEDWEQLRPTIVARVAALVEAIRRAEFPMHSADEKCTQRCNFATVCRVHQTRALSKQWSVDRTSAEAGRGGDSRASADENTTDEKTTDEKTTDEKTTDEKTTDKNPDERASS